jgi:hypothetical protein
VGLTRSFVVHWITRAVVTLNVACADAAAEPDKHSTAAPERGAFDSETVTIDGEVREFGSPTSEMTPSSGVRVCQDELQLCTETSVAGRWRLEGLSPAREILLSFEKPGYRTTLQPIVTPQFSSEIGAVLLSSNDAANQLLMSEARTALGPEDAAGLGAIAFTAQRPLDTYLDQSIRVRLLPEQGIRPIYALNPDWTYASEIPEDSAAAWAIFVDVPPGDYELEYTMDDGECIRVSTDSAGWPAHDGRTNVTRVTARADSVTYQTTQVCVGEED